MRKQSSSLIVTVFNEQDTVAKFIKSVLSQSQYPDELIIVDGGSTDKTIKEINDYRSKIKESKIKFCLIIKKGNRSVGRNEAIKTAKGEIILCSDAGCLLDRDWVKNITKPFEDTSVDVVAGYYKPRASSVFQKCLSAYVLVMPDKINPDEFLPAARSLAFKKSMWKKIGGFPQRYSHNEDYVFSNKLKSSKAKIVFVKRAIVYWFPRKNIREAFIMFFRFAYGDGEAGIYRGKVLLVFARYCFYVYFVLLCFLIKSSIILSLVIISNVIYMVWSVKKNYKYVKDKRAFVILPILQLEADASVIFGTALGFAKKITKINYFKLLINNFPLTTLMVIYIATMILVIKSGIPNQNHPFTYQMDEWHQAQAVRTVFKYGSANVEGSANGTMFNFFISGIMLVPFYVSKIVNPFLIKSAVDAVQEQAKLFIVLRLFTLFFGLISLIVLSKIAKILNLNAFSIIAVFLFTPVWLVLSNYFKYDIALVFWIVLAFFYFIKYGIDSNSKNFLLACFFSGVAVAVKVSALPLFPLIICAHFLFARSFRKNYRYLLLGILIFIFNGVFLGFPDIVFGGKNMNEYLYENIISGPTYLFNIYNLSYFSLLSLSFFHKLPAIFGHALYMFSIPAVVYFLFLTVRDFQRNKHHDFKIKFFILLSFAVFCVSLIPLGITLSANRALVVLPFIAVIDVVVLKEVFAFIQNKLLLKFIVSLLLIIVFVIQTLESYLWVEIKIRPSPQQISSDWVGKNISRNSNIGLENIPIYQFEPDFILQEFYTKQYYPKLKTKYNYFIVDKNTKILPEYIVLSNVQTEKKYFKRSSKNELIRRLYNEKYEKIGYFPLTLPLYEYFDSYFYYPYLGLFAYPDGITIYEKK